MTEFLSLVLKLPVVLIFLTFFIRLMGKKELKQNTPIDLVYLVLLVTVGWDMLLESKYTVLHIFVALSVLTACRNGRHGSFHRSNDTSLESPLKLFVMESGM